MVQHVPDRCLADGSRHSSRWKTAGVIWAGAWGRPPSGSSCTRCARTTARLADAPADGDYRSAGGGAARAARPDVPAPRHAQLHPFIKDARAPAAAGVTRVIRHPDGASVLHAERPEVHRRANAALPPLQFEAVESFHAIAAADAFSERRARRAAETDEASSSRPTRCRSASSRPATATPTGRGDRRGVAAARASPSTLAFQSAGRRRSVDRPYLAQVIDDRS